MFSSKSCNAHENLEMASLDDIKIPPIEECVYTSCYCEENVWKLCEYVKNNQSILLPKCYAVFISNRFQVVPFWYQKSGDGDTKLAVWDYHVIFIYKSGNDTGTMVYDFDTTLPFPTTFEKYTTCTFRDGSVHTPYERFFRVVTAEDFLKYFASDRSRMLNPDGTWMKEPPPYPCLRTLESTNNIEDFINMDPAVGIGEVLDIKQFVEKFL